MSSGFEENEISAKAFGGTELTKRGLEKYINPELLAQTQIICSRVRELDPTKIRIYWVHDTPTDPECSKLRDHNFRDQFHLIAFTSQYQYLQFRNQLGLPYDERFRVIESCIEPIDHTEEDKKSDTINCIYSSTPQRGLELLLPAFKFLYERNDKLRLHVFSSFKIYGWDDMDKNFEPLYDEVRNHPGMVYHEFSGANSNNDVREQLKKSHIFTYPCIWDETFCRSMVEAMSAGCICVHPNFAALPFTSGGLNVMYPGDADKNKHVNTFMNHLNLAIMMHTNGGPQLEQRLGFNKAFVDTNYSAQIIGMKLESQIRYLVDQFPNEESRKIPSPTLIFKTS
jgi:glycosyltransferase involved in cell wall biosynthesis